MSAHKPRKPISRDAAFKAVNEIENALVDAETTMALFSAMIDNDLENDSTCVGAIERHLASDVTALRAAFNKAHAALFLGGAK